MWPFKRTPIISDDYIRKLGSERAKYYVDLAKDYGDSWRGLTPEDCAASFEAGAFWATTTNSRREIERIWPSEYYLFFKLWEPSFGGKPISPIVARRVMEVLKRVVFLRYEEK